MANTANTSAKAETKKLTFEELSKLPVGDLATFLKKIVRVELAVTKAKDAFTSSLQFNAKVVAALKRAYVVKLNSREIAPDTTFKKYFEQNSGGSLPGRVEALAALFNSLVLTIDANGKPLLSEECFDAAAVDWLEKANAIVKHAQKTHGDAWKTCDEVLDTINALSKPGDALKKIKDIRERQKGEKEEKTETGADGASQPLTVGRALEFIKAAITAAGTLPDKEAFQLFRDVSALPFAWEKSGVNDDKISEWATMLDEERMLAIEKNEHGVAPHMEVVTEAPADAVAA